MASSVPTVEAIKEGFPHLSIPRHPGEPTYEAIHAVHNLLKANAASMPSDLGGGDHGLLGLVLSATVYSQVAGALNPFTRPANPGSTPTIPALSTGEQTRRLERDHKENLRVYREVNRTDQALKQQLLRAFDDMYFKALKNTHVGYSNSTTMQLIQHLYNSYGQITQMDLSDNERRMKTPYDPSTPIENLFGQIDDAIDFADAGSAPFTAVQVLTTAYLLVFQTGQYEKACDEWFDKATGDKTWNTFQTHFSAAHQKMTNKQRLRHAGFNPLQGQANAIQQQEVQHETAMALQALADATESDRTAVANLTAANKELTTHLSKMTSTISALETKVSQLERKIDQLLTNSTKKSNHNRNSDFYCWSHGRTFNPKHTSKTCNYRKDGHKEEATLVDRMGGSNLQCTKIESK